MADTVIIDCNLHDGAFSFCSRISGGYVRGIREVAGPYSGARAFFVQVSSVSPDVLDAMSRDISSLGSAAKVYRGELRF